MKRIRYSETNPRLYLGLCSGVIQNEIAASAPCFLAKARRGPPRNDPVRVNDTLNNGADPVRVNDTLNNGAGGGK